MAVTIGSSLSQMEEFSAKVKSVSEFKENCDLGEGPYGFVPMKEQSSLKACENEIMPTSN